MLFYALCFSHNFTEEMKEYDDTLKKFGADIVEWSVASDIGNVSCVTQSQMERLFAYR